MRLTRILLTALLLSPGGSCMKAPRSRSTEDIVREYIAVWNGSGDDALDTLLDPAFQRTGDALSESANGVDALRALLRKMRLDMPDLNVTVLDAVYAGDRAAVHWELSGTDSGPGDFPPTHRRTRAFGLSLYAVRDGRIANEVVVLDGLSFMLQLGFTIAPPGAAPGGKR